MPRTTRRQVLAAAAALAALPLAARAGGPVVRVAKTATCGCCNAWVAHLREAGFTVEAGNMDHGALHELKSALGIRPEHQSCHTAEVDGYIVEGHVPAGDLRALLAERPAALGLSVPEMPIGSPGMEMDGTVEPYDTLLLSHDGRATVFRSHR